MLGVGVIIPLATETTEAGPHHSKYKRHRKYRKYSKAWWRAISQASGAHAALWRPAGELSGWSSFAWPRHARPKRSAHARKERHRENKRRGRAAVAAAVGRGSTRGWTKTSATPARAAVRRDRLVGTDRSATRSSASSVRRWAITNARQHAGRRSDHIASPRRHRPHDQARTAGSLTTIRKDIDGKQVYVVVAQSQNGGRSSVAHVLFHRGRRTHLQRHDDLEPVTRPTASRTKPKR